MKFRLLLGLFFLFYSWVSLHAEIKVIPDRQYFDIVCEELSQAKKSIEVEMYLVYSNNSQVKELLDEIVEAKERGVIFLLKMFKNKVIYTLLRKSYQFYLPILLTM